MKTLISSNNFGITAEKAVKSYQASKRKIIFFVTLIVNSIIGIILFKVDNTNHVSMKSITLIIMIVLYLTIIFSKFYWTLFIDENRKPDKDIIVRYLKLIKDDEFFLSLKDLYEIKHLNYQDDKQVEYAISMSNNDEYLDVQNFLIIRGCDLDVEILKKYKDNEKLIFIISELKRLKL